MKRKALALLTAITVICLIFLFAACGGSDDLGGSFFQDSGGYPYIEPADGNYVYDGIEEQDFALVSENPSSYFSLDRNTASYSYVRRQLNDGLDIAPDSVRVEELINYFDYDFPAPVDKAIGVSAYLADCPWNAENKLMLVGVKTSLSELETENANYVFLIDVSGSMAGKDRLGLAVKGMEKLTDSLGDKDVVSVVTYASGVRKVLDGTECSDEGKTVIKHALGDLTASGSTAGGEGLLLAYETARNHFIENGNNRVIIISDGDFNVGMTDLDELKEFIQDKAKENIYLTVLGVGMGNTRDDLLETLAINGNGNYAYLDNELEAEKVLCEELDGTLKTVAKDAKAGVTFTSAVEKYRLIGYDTKIISQEDFENENADAGEIGSNLCVAALYEIKLAESEETRLADVEIKYKDVSAGETDESVKIEVTVDTPSSDDLSFISCVAEFGLLLRRSDYKGDASFEAVTERLAMLENYIGDDAYKSEFVTLVGKASELYAE